MNNILSYLKEHKAFYTAIIAAIVSIVTVVSSYVNDANKNSINDGQFNIRNCQELFDKMTLQVASLAIEIEVLRKENTELRINQISNNQNNSLFNNSIDQMLYPYKVSTIDGTVVKINTTYETFYLSPNGFNSNDYINNKDISVWDKQTSSMFRRSDLQTINTKALTRTQIRLLIGDSMFTIVLHKYPIYLNSVVIGVGEISIPQQ